MGVSIFASWRHPNVVVMAPALTEAGQSQNYTDKLTPTLKNLLDSGKLSPSLVSGLNWEGQELEFHLLKLIAAAEGRNSRTANGFATNDIVGIQKTNGIVKKLPVDFHPSEPTKIEKEITAGKSKQFNKSSMNKGISMGDEYDTMGLLKSSAQSEQGETVPLHKGNIVTMDQSIGVKEKRLSNDMDQLLKNFAVMSNEIGSGDFAAPNVEELLQVINSMGDNEVVLDAPSDNTEAEIFPLPLSGTDLASFESDLLDNVDMTTFEDNIPDPSVDMKLSIINEKVEDSNKRLFEIERNCQRSLRRLKKSKARLIGKHASAEVMGLFVYSSAQQYAKQGVQAQCRTDNNMGKEKKVKGVSSSTLMNLLQRLNTASASQVSALQNCRPDMKYFGSGSVDIPESSGALSSSILPKLQPEEKQEVKAVAQQLHSQVHHVERQLDSDVTASSSGGESCDEMENYNNPHQEHKPIVKRALWRWCQDRAAVAYRWTWLQAQITDLEHKLRQHKEYHRQIRANKTFVSLAEEPSRRTTPPISVNGYHGALPGGVAIPPKPAGEEVLNGTISGGCDPTQTASRSRPFLHSAFRKRKLFHAAGLHLLSKKAARPVTIRCNCLPSVESCILCTGRPDPTQPLGDRPDVSTNAERISLLDPAFHPVLSFPRDACLTVHLDSVMRLQEWQRRINRYSPNYTTYGTIKERERVDRERRPRLKKKLKLSEHKSLDKVRKHTAAALSAKLKRKLNVSQRKRRDLKNSEHLPLPLLKIKKTRKHSSRSNLDESDVDDEEHYLETVSADGRSSRRASRSPEPSPGGLGTLNTQGLAAKRDRDRDRSEDSRKRGRDDDSYDIDNIVIPYSMAASTRVERLQYKEILTPKWRVVKVEECDASRAEELEEDMSDEAFAERHARCEEGEKKKFMSYMKLPLAVRSRGNRRTDSRAESSGANTPDPMSPATAEPAEVGAASPMTTPPATPGCVLDDTAATVAASAVVCRKRTVSSSRWHTSGGRLAGQETQRASEERSSTPDPDHEVLPYDVRSYPLTDEQYEEMLRDMPEDHMALKLAPAPLNEYNSNHAIPESPSTSSTISAEEDPNDPEWTVSDLRDPREDSDKSKR